MSATLDRRAAETTGVVTDPPPAFARAEGVDLLGAVGGSGYKDGAALVRRPDGQMVQLPPMMYGLLEEADGSRDIAALAAAMSERLERRFDEEHVTALIEKLWNQGLLAGSEANAPQKLNPLLALRWKVLITDPKVTKRITAPFEQLFRLWIVVPILVGFAVVFWFVLIHKGVASATAQAFNSPELLLLVVGLGIASAGLHEVGHAAACRYGGGRPGGMGAGIYVVWPAFYTDVTDAYRLPRRARLRTDLGGLYLNAVIAVATLGGVARSARRRIAARRRPAVARDGQAALTDHPGRRLPHPLRRDRRPGPLPAPRPHAAPPAPAGREGLVGADRPRARSRDRVGAGDRPDPHQHVADGDPAPAQARGDDICVGLAHRLGVARPGRARGARVGRADARPGPAGHRQRPDGAAHRAHRGSEGPRLDPRPTRAGRTAGGGRGRHRRAAGMGVVAVGPVPTGARERQRDAVGRGAPCLFTGKRRAASVAGPADQPHAGQAPCRGDDPGRGRDQEAPGVLHHQGREGSAVGGDRERQRTRDGPDARRWSDTWRYLVACGLRVHGLDRVGQPGPGGSFVGQDCVVVRADPPAGATSSTSGSPVTATTFPFKLPSKPGPHDSQALATNDTDGGIKYDVVYSMVTVQDGATVDETNSAYALASCKACTTVAVSFQLVLIVGQTKTITPINIAEALNVNCPSCVTTAIANQIVVTIKSQPSQELSMRLNAALRKLDGIASSGAGGSPSEIAAQVQAVQEEIERDLDESGLLANPPDGTTGSRSGTSTTSTGSGSPGSTSTTGGGTGTTSLSASSSSSTTTPVIDDPTTPSSTTTTPSSTTTTPVIDDHDPVIDEHDALIDDHDPVLDDTLGDHDPVIDDDALDEHARIPELVAMTRMTQ